MVVNSSSKRRLGAAAAAGAVAAATLVAFGGSSEGATKASSSISGQTINVAIAYPAPKAMLAKFTKETGVKVNWNYIQWDALQTKIAAAAQANSYFADVADVDWSKIGEYYTTKWFIPLNKYFSPASVSKQYPQAATFIRNGQLIGLPMDASLLVTTENTKAFKQAGITSAPKTLVQYDADLRRSPPRRTLRRRWTSHSPLQRASPPIGTRPPLHSAATFSAAATRRSSPRRARPDTRRWRGW